MDENMIQIIDKLATKLGTTAEYLWSVLVKQAPLTGIIHLLFMLGMVVAVVWWFGFVKKRTTCPPKTHENQYPQAVWEKEMALPAWFSVFSITLIVMVIIGENLPLIVAAFFNPEYWALKQILP